MTATPSNPTPNPTPNPTSNPTQSGQPTRITWKTRLQKFRNSPPIATITLVILGVSFLLDLTNNAVQSYQSFCRTDLSSPWCPPQKLDSAWIGTKIEDVYNKNIKKYEPETTLLVTDKPDNNPEDKDISILRNVDQDNSIINLGTKKNSGQYEAFLRKARNERKPVCLRIYGKRKFETSEFKNIIDYSEFPADQIFKNLTPQQRAQIFKNLTPQQLDQLYKRIKPQQRDQIYNSLTLEERDQACKQFNTLPRWQAFIKRFL